MTKLYNEEDFDLSDFVSEIIDLRQPIFVYAYSDELNNFILVSEVEIDDEDLESVFELQIKEYYKNNDGDWLDEDDLDVY